MTDPALTQPAMTDPADRVLVEILALASERFPGKALSADQDLFETLGIDSMDVLGLLSELERRFEVEIPDYELQDVRTFRDLAAVVESRL